MRTLLLLAGILVPSVQLQASAQDFSFFFCSFYIFCVFKKNLNIYIHDPFCFSEANFLLTSSTIISRS